MKSKILFSVVNVLINFSTGVYAQSKDLFINKLTAINPVSYTDVIYMGTKDTALVSTYSGRIAVRVNGVMEEKVIARLNDEIYSLAYHPVKKEIAASTLENGVVVIGQKNGNILKSLKLKSTWSINIFYSEDFHYLITQDQKGNRYIWDAANNYKEVTVSTKVPSGRIVKMDSNGHVTIASKNKIIIWDVKNEVLVKEMEVELARFSDIDNQGNVLSIDFNECAKHNLVLTKNDFILKHPNWLRDIKDYPDYQNLKEQSPELFSKDGLLIMEGYHMQLTMARFAKNRIYTASIDRSIRVWDKDSGSLIHSLTGHNATVNKIKVNTSETQLVSVDLKGGIKFWDIID